VQPGRENAQLSQRKRQPAIQQRADDDALVVALQQIGRLRGAQQRPREQESGEIQQRGQNDGGEQGQHQRILLNRKT
jgi:hypothetical protein